MPNGQFKQAISLKKDTAAHIRLVTNIQIPGHLACSHLIVVNMLFILLYSAQIYSLDTHGSPLMSDLLLSTSGQAIAKRTDSDEDAGSLTVIAVAGKAALLTACTSPVPGSNGRNNRVIKWTRGK